MTNDIWYYANGNEPVGPMSLDDLGLIVTSLPNGGEILVWKSGFAQWQKVKSVPELAVLFIEPPTPSAPMPKLTEKEVNDYINEQIRLSMEKAEIADRPARRAAWRADLRECFLQCLLLAVLLILAHQLVPSRAAGAVEAGVLLWWFLGIAMWSTRAQPPVQRSLVRKILFGLEREESIIHIVMAFWIAAAVFGLIPFK